jgi:hypothetical protein
MAVNLSPSLSSPYTPFSISPGDLSVRQVPHEKWETIAEISKLWSERFSVKEKIANEHVFKKIFIECVHVDMNPWLMLSNAMTISSGISYIASYPTCEEKNVILACYDKSENIQALAIYEPNVNELKCIVTNPDNLKTQFDDDTSPRAVHGAGTEVILYLAQKSLQLSLPLKLNADQTAIPFYEKLHFDKEEFDFNREEGGLDMKLSAEKILTLITAETPPFNRFKK